MKRGDIVVVRQKGVFTSKPRPAVVVQASTLLDDGSAVIMCLITGDLAADPPFYRIDVRPTPQNGLTKASQIMADLPVPILVANVADTIGVLDDATLAKVSTALALMLELG